MMRAEERRRETEKVIRNEKIFQKELENIEERIINAVENGEFSCSISINKDVVEKVLNVLESQGYKYDDSNTSTAGERDYKISW